MDAYSVSSILHSNLTVLLKSHPSRRIAILDANLIVFFVASMGEEVDLFSSFKRSRILSKHDVPALHDLLSQFSSVATNAYVLAESSNLANELSGFRRNLWFEALARFTSVTLEIHIGTQKLASSPMLVPFGITDAALGSLPENYVLITADGPLFGYLSGSGKIAVNFSHYRFA